MVDKFKLIFFILFYCGSEDIMRKVINIVRDNFISVGIRIGKFIKIRRFRFYIIVFDFMVFYVKVYVGW